MIRACTKNPLLRRPKLLLKLGESIVTWFATPRFTQIPAPRIFATATSDV